MIGGSCSSSSRGRAVELAVALPGGDALPGNDEAVIVSGVAVAGGALLSLARGRSTRHAQRLVWSPAAWRAQDLEARVDSETSRDVASGQALPPLSPFLPVPLPLVNLWMSRTRGERKLSWCDETAN